MAPALTLLDFLRMGREAFGDFKVYVKRRSRATLELPWDADKGVLCEGAWHAGAPRHVMQTLGSTTTKGYVNIFLNERPLESFRAAHSGSTHDVREAGRKRKLEESLRNANAPEAFQTGWTLEPRTHGHFRYRHPDLVGTFTSTPRVLEAIADGTATAATAAAAAELVDATATAAEKVWFERQAARELQEVETRKLRGKREASARADLDLRLAAEARSEEAGMAEARQADVAWFKASDAWQRHLAAKLAAAHRPPGA